MVSIPWERGILEMKKNIFILFALALFSLTAVEAQESTVESFKITISGEALKSTNALNVTISSDTDIEDSLQIQSSGLFPVLTSFKNTSLFEDNNVYVYSAALSDDISSAEVVISGDFAPASILFEPIVSVTKVEAAGGLDITSQVQIDIEKISPAAEEEPTPTPEPEDGNEASGEDGSGTNENGESSQIEVASEGDINVVESEEGGKASLRIVAGKSAGGVRGVTYENLRLKRRGTNRVSVKLVGTGFLGRVSCDAFSQKSDLLLFTNKNDFVEFSARSKSINKKLSFKKKLKMVVPLSNRTAKVYRGEDPSEMGIVNIDCRDREGNRASIIYLPFIKPPKKFDTEVITEAEIGAIILEELEAAGIQEGNSSDGSDISSDEGGN